MRKVYIILLILTLFGAVIISGCVNQPETTDSTGPTATDSATREAYDPSKMVFVAMGPENQIKVINPLTDEAVDTLPANNNPHGIAVTPDGRYIFTTGTRMGPNEMIMEPGHDDSGEMGDESAMSTNGENMMSADGENMMSADGENMMSADGENMMSTNGGGHMGMNVGTDYIAVTDTSSRKIIKKIDVGGGTHHMAITPDGKTVLASIPSKGGIAVIDTKNLEMSDLIKTGNVTDYIAITRDGKRAYVSNKGDNTLSIVDLASRKEIAEIPVPVRPSHITVNYDGTLVYVAVSGSDEVAVINASTNTIEARITVGDVPHGITITRDNKKVYVSNSEGKSVSVIDTTTNTVIKEIPVSGEVEHIEVIPTTRKVYANGESAGIIWIIDTRTDTLLKNTIETGLEPHQIALPLSITGYRDITASELKAMMSQEDVFLADTHIPEQQHIKDTDTFIPFNEIEANLDRLPTDKNTRIVVYCRSGSMSAVASEKLVELGYTDVNNLLGGTVEWRKQGYEFEEK